MKNILPYFIISIFTILVFCTSSCKKDNSYFEGKAKIEVSTDTLLFDTVFTQVGSATRSIKVYNKESQAVLIDIDVEKGSSSFFRINADGYKGNSLKNIEVPANDSIYIFVETTIDPDQPLSISPFIVEDKLIIHQEEQTKEIILSAYGQNANYVPVVNGKGFVSLLSCNLGTITWNDPKPYVIYGVLVIDSCSLVIPAGTNIYVHGGVVVNNESVYNDGQIIILENGKLVVNGTPEKIVRFEGTRLEEEYNDISGQWVGIRIFPESKGNKIQNAKIRNAIIGVSIDSASTLVIENTSIENPAAYGIFARHSEIVANNIQIYGSGSHSMVATYGGKYEINYATMYSDLNQDESLRIDNFECVDEACNIRQPNQLDIKVTNSIIAGGSEDEIALIPASNDHVGNLFQYQFANCVVRVKEILKEEKFQDFLTLCDECISYKTSDKLFKDRGDYNLMLDSLSIAIGKAKILPQVLSDINGKLRDANPDIGCFEY